MKYKECSKMKEQILEILADIREDVDFENQDGLIDKGLIDSVDVVVLVSSLCEEFDIKIPANKIVSKNFNSVDAMVNMIEEIMDED